MKTIKALATALMAIVCLSQADAQVMVKKKSITGIPENQSDSLKEVKYKPKDGYTKMKSKSYSGYYEYYGDRFYWDRQLRLYYTVDKNGERTYYEPRFQPY